MGLDFTGKVAVITGAGQGLGKICALAFARLGARVCIAELATETGTASAHEFEEQGFEAMSVQVDVTDPKQVEKCLSQVLARFGRVDILLNNAGIRGVHDSLEISEDMWDTIIRTNLLSVFICSQVFGRQMIRQGQGGAILSISSIASLSTFPLRAGYGAAKAGINQLTKALALEWARYGIRVNAVAPGMINTEMFRRMVQSGILDMAALNGRIPLGRVCAPEEIADVVTVLSSDLTSYVTGQTWYVDGGWTARGAFSYASPPIET